MRIPIAKTFFDQRDIEIIVEPLKSGWVVQGPFVEKFEKKFSDYVGAPYSVAVSSGTTALHVALAALGIREGDEVVVPAFTWIATANAVEYVGAKPVFCDIDLESYNIDVSQVEAKISGRTKAIVPVHLFGLPAEMDEIGQISRKHDLAVVEDAACGFGAYYRGRHVGNFGDIGCFSFHPRKAITTGEGGMLTTSSEETDSLLRALRDHGATKLNSTRHGSGEALLLPQYDHLGYNYRMTDFQGALGVSQMEKAQWIQSQRKAKAAVYDELLMDVEFLRIPRCPQHTRHGYQSYVCLFQPESARLERLKELNQSRNRLMLALEEQGISTRQGTHAVTLQGYYQSKYGIKDEDYPNACMADRLTIALPLFPQITDEEQNCVVAALKEEFVGIT